MDFRFTPQEEALREEAREFVRREWRDVGKDVGGAPASSYDSEDHEEKQRVREFAKKLADKGWWTMHWPEEYGGAAAPVSTVLAYRETMAYEGAPATLGGGFVAPMIMIHGSDWQKQFFLPRIANADYLNFSQGFSEPNAGSDLGNVQTRAVRDGDDWLMTGQKIWNSESHYSEWGHYLVRTDPNLPKHRGVSYFFLDMKSPGITHRPLYDGLGRRRWSEVFLDQVRVPARNLIGELNRGFYAAMTALSFERSLIETPTKLLRALERFVDEAKRGRGRSVLDDPIVAHRLADLRVQIEANRMLCYRVAWMQSHGDVPGKEASMVKLVGDELGTQVFKMLARIVKEESLYLPRSRAGAPLKGFLGAYEWLSRTGPVGGGTSEVQRNIIAQRGLGLPR